MENDNKLKYLNEMDKIDKCNKCHTCINTCPYHLPITDLIQDVKRTYYSPVKYYRIWVIERTIGQRARRPRGLDIPSLIALQSSQASKGWNPKIEVVRISPLFVTI